jgi:hypothetical protein
LYVKLGGIRGWGVDNQSIAANAKVAVAHGFGEVTKKFQVKAW